MPAAPPPKKSLGQNFLKDNAICGRIAALLQAEPRDKIIEIGPGAGALTRALEAIPHSLLLLLEKDRYWSAARGASGGEGTIAINCDALRFSWNALTAWGKWKIIGNLPYNIASPLIWDILSQCPALKKAVFMVQKEVALRLVAKPGTKSYGALSVWAQNFAAAKLEFSLAQGAFYPPPKVHSAVVSFIPLATRPENPAALKKLLDICFQKRRKQLGTIFRQAGLETLEKTLADMGVLPSERPENLSPRQFRQLSNHLCPPPAL